MKNKQNYIYFAVAVIAIVFIMINGESAPTGITEVSPSLSPSLSPSVSPSVTPTPSSKPIIKPTPGLNMSDLKSYETWVDELDAENKYTVIDDTCSNIKPSNVTYKNNSLIMLDNSASPNSHILKIGNLNHNLAAGKWYLITLSSSTLPADLVIFCEGIELGSIRLEQ